MSVTMTETDGVTVLTLTSDPQSACPPLCQILKGLCYNPLCCSVSQHLRRIQGTSQSVLGALHIMVGLLNIGLGVILLSCDVGGGPWWYVCYTGLPYWLGAMFMLFGIVGIVSEKRPSPCLVIVNVILNLAGVGFAITGIVFYSIMIGDIWVGSMCSYDYDYGYRHNYGYNRPTSSPQEKLMREKCLEGRELVMMLLRGLNGLLIVLSVLELCVAISCLVMGIKALCRSEKREDKSPDDPELYKTLLEDVTSNPTLNDTQRVKFLSIMMEGGPSRNRSADPSSSLPCFPNNNCEANVQSDRFHFLSNRNKESTKAGRMSVTMTKTDGVTVFTLTSDPQSACPPICQIFKDLCYNPLCCSVSQRLRRIQGTSQSVLGALHIMVGLLNIGLGVILFCSYSSWWRIEASAFPFWVGFLFMLFGSVGIVSEKRPSLCLVILNVILNLAGVAFAITAIVLYSINTAKMRLWGMCYYYDDYEYRSHYNRPTQSPREKLMREKCYEGKELAMMLMRGINGLLIVLSVLELCVTISSAVMGIKALRSNEKREDESPDDPELYKTLLEEVTSNPTV
ncbi:uncharacterized protein ABDE67_005930 [Symphorus nematophorus]